MHQDLWNIKGVFSFSFSFPCKVCCQGEQRGLKRPRSAHSDHGGQPGPAVMWPAVLHDHLTAPSRQTQRATKRARRDNRENVWRMKVLWLSLFLGGFIFSILLILCSLSVCCLFCYKRWLKKREKENVVGWSLYSGRGWGDAPIRRHFYNMVHSAFISVNHFLYSLACPCPRREWLNKIQLFQFHSHVL